MINYQWGGLQVPDRSRAYDRDRRRGSVESLTSTILATQMIWMTISAWSFLHRFLYYVSLR